MRPTFVIGSEDADLRFAARTALEQSGFDADFRATAGEIASAVALCDVCGALIDGRMADAIRACLQTKEIVSDRNFRLVAIIDGKLSGEIATFTAAGADEILFHPAIGKIAGIAATLTLPAGQLIHDDIAMEIGSRRVWRGERPIDLPRIEFEILRNFLLRPRWVFTRREIITAAWPRHVYVHPKTVDVHIARLRKLLKRDGSSDPIRSVRGHGYGLDVPPLISLEARRCAREIF